MTKSQAQDDAELDDFGVVLWAAILDACGQETGIRPLL